MRSKVATFSVVVAVVLLPGCLGSPKPYRPYAGESRPLENPPPDPTAEKMRRETMSYEDVQKDVDFTQSRKDIKAVTESVPHNPWRSYEGDMTNEKMVFLLGPYSKIKKAAVASPDEKKKPPTEGEEGAAGGEKKPEPKKEEAGEKKSEGGDSGGDKKEEKKEGGDMGGGDKKEGEGN
jgi:hypothetical protein